MLKVARIASSVLSSLADIIRGAASFLSPSNVKNFEAERIREISKEFEQIFNKYVNLKESSHSKLSKSDLEDLVSQALSLTEKINETAKDEKIAKNDQFNSLLADLFTLFELWCKEDGYNFDSQQIPLLKKFSLQFCERAPKHALRFISSCLPELWDSHEWLLQLLESEARKEIEFWMFYDLRGLESRGEDSITLIVEECKILASLSNRLESLILEYYNSEQKFVFNEEKFTLDSHSQEPPLKEGSVSLGPRVNLELEAIDFVSNFLGNHKAKNFLLNFARLKQLQADYPTLYRKAIATLARSALLICDAIDKDLISPELSQEILCTFLVELQSHLGEALPLSEALLGHKIQRARVKFSSH